MTDYKTSNDCSPSSSAAKYSVLLVCLGNICRSPLAEGVIRQAVVDGGYNLSEWLIDSAGTAAYHIDDSPDDRSIKIAKQHGFDISQHRGAQLQPADFNKYQYILVMDQSNYRNSKRIQPKDSMAVLEMYLTAGEEVPDPYYDGLSAFEAVYQLLHKHAEAWVNRIINSNTSTSNNRGNKTHNKSNNHKHNQSAGVAPVDADVVLEALRIKTAKSVSKDSQ
jgi:protein-tyrosine-phosphatase